MCIRVLELIVWKFLETFSPCLSSLRIFDTFDYHFPQYSWDGKFTSSTEMKSFQSSQKFSYSIVIIQKWNCSCNFEFSLAAFVLFHIFSLTKYQTFTFSTYKETIHCLIWWTVISYCSEFVSIRYRMELSVIEATQCTYSRKKRRNMKCVGKWHAIQCEWTKRYVDERKLLCF